MDWNLPSLTDAYTDFLSFLKSRDLDLAKGLDPAIITVTNPVSNMIRWNSANKYWEKYNGSSWVALSASYAITVDLASAVAAAGVTSAMLRDSAGVSVIGRSANSTGVPADIVASADDRVLVRTGGALSFSQLAVGMAPNSVWTYAKLQDVAATDRILGRSSSGAGVIQEIVCTAAGRALIDDADAATQRTTLDVPKRDGTNASGTWNISISGSAASIGGYAPAEAATVSTLAARTSAGYLFWVYGNQSSSNSENPSVSQVMVTNGSDNYMRKASLAHLSNSMRGVAKAWVRFNGGTGAVGGSYNVSSVTQNGAGDYTVNFSNSFSGASAYSGVVTAGQETPALLYTNGPADTPSASSYRFITVNAATGTGVDSPSCSAAFFGDL